MDILHINTAAGWGWANKIATDLNKELNKKWISSHLIVNHNRSPLKDISTFSKKKYDFFSNKLRYIKIKFNELFGLQDTIYSKYNILVNNKYYQEADIIHFHNIHGRYFDIRDIEKISNDWKKIIWTLHDTQSITGKCANNLDCEKRLTGCGKCPYKKLYPKIYLDTTHKFWNIKKEIYSKSNFILTPPSQWLVDRAKKAPIMKWKKVKLIYNGIDTNVFKKYEKLKSREKFWLPNNKFIALFISAGGKSNIWKWWQYIDKIISEFSNEKDIYFISIWNSKENEIGNLKEFWFIKDPNILAQLYSTADVFIYPSLADNCPLVVLEALSCWLPVVSFATGGIPELIEDKKNGYIAEYMNFQELKKWVEYFRKNPNSEIKLDEKFKLENMVDNYIKLYNDMI